MILDAETNIDPREVEEIMSQPLDWMPGCPFGAEAAESQFYMK